MEPNKRVRVIPVSPRSLAAVDHQNGRVGPGDEGVGEGQASCAGTNDEIVDLERCVRHHGGWYRPTVRQLLDDKVEWWRPNPRARTRRVGAGRAGDRGS